VLNQCEAVAWFVVAAWVWRRYRRLGGGARNNVYGSCFVVFGHSDVMESQVVPL
jgi:hypothetical protein